MDLFPAIVGMLSFVCVAALSVFGVCPEGACGPDGPSARLHHALGGSPGGTPGPVSLWVADAGVWGAAAWVFSLVVCRARRTRGAHGIFGPETESLR